LCFAVIHNVPLSRTGPSVNENANHSQQCRQASVRALGSV
jgi:hypothetical protein